MVSVDLKGDIHGINKLGKGRVQENNFLTYFIGTGGVLFEDMPRVFKLAKTTTYELLKSQNKHISKQTMESEQ